MTMRVGVDVGGTFTDLVALDETTGMLTKIKVPSTPLDPERGVIAAVNRLIEKSGPAAIGIVAHSTTIATNALLGQIHLDLPRVALLTTAGFRDVLEIGRQNRSEVYNLFVRRPRPLVERGDRIGVRERLDAAGMPIVPLDEAAIDAALLEIERRGVNAVAVSFLHAYRNPAHERAMGDALRARFAHIDVSLSSDIDPEYREYERTSTTVVNALLIPLVRTYLERLANALERAQVTAPLYVMQSGGGMASVEEAAARPATLIESGPASGVIGAAYIGRLLGIDNVLSFDMGGTTAKAGTIAGGEPQVTAEFEAAGRTHSGRAVHGSGYPVRFPFIDLAEVSAGGGTIAFIDAGGALRVGPLSAGADPGPAAYGKGDQATVTDANVVLGRLNPRALLGGEMPIEADRSRAAIAALVPHLGGLSIDEAAAGIVHLIDMEMAKILRIVSIERGHDPRGFAMLAFGGGGPLHACALAGELHVARVIVPANPGLFSAFGLLTADVRSTAVQSIVALAYGFDAACAEAVFAHLESDGAQRLRRQNVAPDAMVFVRELDMRYAGQSFELQVPARAPFDDAALADAIIAFHERHERTYGYASRTEAVEIVNARVTSVGQGEKPVLARAADLAPPAPPADAQLETRAVYFTGHGRIATPVWQRERLLPGNRFAGPAVVEQYDSCTLVPPGWCAQVDPYGHIVIEAEPGAA